MVIDSFNEAYIKGELSETQRQIIISLIFKKDERYLFKNYRPISLSNLDYKILAFVMASRLQKVLHKLISPEQVAYVKERFIGQNVRLLLDIIEYSKANNKSGVVLFLDFEKAFDSLSWDFIHKCLKKMGLKPDFCRWVKVIYTHPKAFIKINGFLSKSVSIERGIRQGCPLSALIFIICTEFLSLHIKQNANINGISIDDGENIQNVKITQYADDTCIFLDDYNQIPYCLNQINIFSNISGLKLNINKTEGLKLSENENHNSDFGIKWPETPIRYLGIYLSNDMLQCQTLNWTSKLEKMQKLLDSWRTRKLTLLGKILIIKTLALPKIVYTATMLPVPQFVTKSLNKMLYSFIWGKRDKIKRLVMINKYENGGLNMIDIESHLSAIKAAWIPRIYCNYDNRDEIWKTLPKLYIDKATLGHIDNMNFTKIDHITFLSNIPDFYKEVILGFCKSKLKNEILTKNDLFNSFIWGNTNFMVNKKCLMSKDFMDAGILYIRDILQENGRLLPNVYLRLKTKHYYFQTISLVLEALKPYKHLRFDVDTVNVVEIDQIEADETLVKYHKRKCKWFYDKIVSEKAIKNTVINRWSRIFECMCNCKDFYDNKMKCNVEVKITEFNYKLFSNILATGSNLYKWKKMDDDLCIYCHTASHDSKHLLWECNHLQNIWFIIGNILRFNINWKQIVFGVNDRAPENCCISIISYIIYKKFLVDKDKMLNQQPSALNLYVKRELQYKHETYKHLSNTVLLTRFIDSIIYNL